MEERVFIGVGSNIEPEQNIRAGLAMLAKEIRFVAISTFYQTDPLNSPGSSAFCNGVVLAATRQEPPQIRALLRRIETALGRERTQDKNAPRTLDLDLLLHGNRVENDNGHALPHPDIFACWFIGVGLMELDPALVLPESGMSISRVVDGYPPFQKHSLPELSYSLRKECIA